VNGPNLFVSPYGTQPNYFVFAERREEDAFF
jgi:hypothetical protein